MSAASPSVVVSLPSVAASEISCDENSASWSGDRKSAISSTRRVSEFQLMIVHWTPTSRWSCGRTGDDDDGWRRDSPHLVTGSSIGCEWQRRIAFDRTADRSSVSPGSFRVSLRQRSRRYDRTPRDFTFLRPTLGAANADVIPCSSMLLSAFFFFKSVTFLLWIIMFSYRYYQTSRSKESIVYMLRETTLNDVYTVW